jgi:carboxypeptidase Taq
LSAQFFAAARRDRPSLPDDVERGNLAPLLDWLRTKLYQHGRKYVAPTLVERVTGQPMTIAPYITYLRQKFGELYEL